MRSQRLQFTGGASGAAAAAGVSIGDVAIRIAAPARAPVATRAALLGSVCIGALAMLGPGTRACGRRHLDRSGRRVDHGHQLELESPPQTPCPTARRRSRNNGAPTSVTISNSTSINTIEFDAAAPAYSFTVQNGATFTITNQISNSSSLLPDLHVSTGATMAIGNGGLVEIGSLAGAGALQSARPIPTPSCSSREAPAPRSPASSAAPAPSRSTAAQSLRLTGRAA